MGTAIAAKEFVFPIWRYDNKELDHEKTKKFFKGEELPLPLVLILEQGNVEFVEYRGGKSKISDVEEPKKKVIKKRRIYKRRGRPRR